MSNTRKAFWTLVALTTLIYAAMLLWTGPILVAEAGGLTPFDLRLTGYTLADSRAFLEALTPKGLALYSGPAGWLDTFFPGMFTLVLMWSIWALTHRRPFVLRFALVLTGFIYGILDYLENASVAVILKTPPDALDGALVSSASRFTVLKFIFVGIAIITIFALLIARARDKRRASGRT